MRTKIFTLLTAFAVSCVQTWDRPDISTDGLQDSPTDQRTDEFFLDIADQEDAPIPDTGCPSGRISCGGTCVDTSTNHEHCGACNQPCETTEVCSGGSCIVECPPGRTNCSGACVDTLTDIDNCGACDRTCPADLHAVPACSAGDCTTACEAGWFDQDGNGSCETLCTPAAETCNGMDDDCDGACDNGFSCCRGETRGCETSCGSGGTESCSTACAWSGCIPPAETCNGIDDDCSGACDDGFACCLGLSGAACTNAAGVSGTRSCLGGCAWSPCCASFETCGNGFDDDCNGTADDGCVTTDCTGYGDTAWGMGPAGCSGADRRCAGGNCITCADAGGYFNTYCWYAGNYGQDCPTVCASRGGVAQSSCTWGASYSFCDVCNHFMGLSGCPAGDPSGPCYAAYLWNYCWEFFTSTGTGDCSETFDWMMRFCACSR
jgi:hypothetical protein